MRGGRARARENETDSLLSSKVLYVNKPSGALSTRQLTPSFLSSFGPVATAASGALLAVASGHVLIQIACFILTDVILPVG